MGNNDFDFGFDSMSDDSDSFGSGQSFDFGNDNSFGNDSLSSDDSFGGNSIPDSAFDGAFEDDTNTSNDFQDTDAGDSGVKKKAILAVIIGVVGFILVLVIASAITNKSKEKVDEQPSMQESVHQYNGGGDASELITTTKNNQSSQTQPSQSTNHSSNSTDSFTWTEISNAEQVNFKDSYTQLTFTVTGIKHYARAVDASGTLVTKTTLTGSLAGMPGTYSIDIPYTKGVILETHPDLGVGSTFTVDVLLGDYNGKTVVGDITTYVE